MYSWYDYHYAKITNVDTLIVSDIFNNTNYYSTYIDKFNLYQCMFPDNDESYYRIYAPNDEMFYFYSFQTHARRIYPYNMIYYTAHIMHTEGAFYSL